MDQLEKIPFYQEGMPHKPIYGTDFLDDLKANWGEEWGIKSPFGKIRKIMLGYAFVNQLPFPSKPDYERSRK